MTIVAHGLIAACSAALLVPWSGWIKLNSQYPDNYLEVLPRMFDVYSYTNVGSVPIGHNVGGLDARPRRVYGSSFEGPPAESGPTWCPKFTPPYDAPLETTWEVEWTVPAGYTYTLVMHYDQEVGTETWYRAGVGSAVRHRDWHAFVRQGFAEQGPGGGGQGGGG